MPLMVGPSRSHPRPIRKCDFARTDWRFQFMDICPKGNAKAKSITQLSFDDFEDDITNLTNGFVLVNCGITYKALRIAASMSMRVSSSGEMLDLSARPRAGRV
ncbi:Uncharacterized protein HZ326_25843 [Fusarium oxysporum f. sp. albedinis]|nr:Uncharacterized protein HZ326_25843 [Fusarium oxysporum f. sp. albedinis]